MGGRLSCAKKHVIKKEKLMASMSPESTVITMEREYSTDTFTTMAEAEESGCLDYDSLSFLTRVRIVPFFKVKKLVLYLHALIIMKNNRKKHQYMCVIIQEIMNPILVTVI